MASSTSDYPEELRHIGEAALFLASLKHTKIDTFTVSLEKLKTDVMGSRKKKNPSPKNRLEPNQDQELSGNPQMLNPKAIMKLIVGYTPPKFPPVECLRGVIGECSKPFEKQLTESDVKDDQSRLAIHKSDLEQFLLPMVAVGEDLENGIPVITYDCNGKEFRMVLKIWCSKQCVLTNGWKAFYHEHGLISRQDFVTLWMFRHKRTGRLCFVVLFRRLPVFELLKRNRTTQA